jgi:hypothetical protein
LLVTPEPLEVTSRPPKSRGDAVERSIYLGGTSGRFAVARYISHLFPGVATEFVQSVEREGPIVADNERGDSVTRVGGGLAEFSTPAGATGLGTEYLEPSGDTIRGAVFLDQTQPAEPNISIVRIRVGASMSQRESELLRVNEQCIQSGC